MTFGEKAADFVAQNIGRWAFIIGQTAVIGWWMWGGGPAGFDPYPFIFLNLCLSLQSAYTGPVLLISNNRQDAQRQMLFEAIDKNTRLTEAHTRLIEEHTDAWEKHSQETHGLSQATHAIVREMHDLQRELHALVRDVREACACRMGT